MGPLGRLLTLAQLRRLLSRRARRPAHVKKPAMRSFGDVKSPNAVSAISVTSGTQLEHAAKFPRPLQKLVGSSVT